MAEITKELGRIPVSRGDYQATTEYYKDNIVQYKRGSYQVVSESPIIGVPPTNDKNVVNPGWTLFAGTLDAQDVVNQVKDQETKSIQAVAAREAEILAKSDASEISSITEGLGGTNVQENLNNAGKELSDLEEKAAKLNNLVLGTIRINGNVTRKTQDTILYKNIKFKADVKYTLNASTDKTIEGQVYLYVKKEDGTNMFYNKILSGETSLTTDVYFTEDFVGYIASNLNVDDTVHVTVSMQNDANTVDTLSRTVEIVSELASVTLGKTTYSKYIADPKNNTVVCDNIQLSKGKTYLFNATTTVASVSLYLYLYNEGRDQVGYKSITSGNTTTTITYTPTKDEVISLEALSATNRIVSLEIVSDDCILDRLRNLEDHSVDILNLQKYPNYITGDQWVNSEQAAHIVIPVSENEIYEIQCSENSSVNYAWLVTHSMVGKELLDVRHTTNSPIKLIVPYKAKFLYIQTKTSTGTDMSPKKVVKFGVKSVTEELNNTTIRNSKAAVYDRELLDIEYSVVGNGCPPNSMKHFKAALATGFKAMKADLVPTVDGKIILCHDNYYLLDSNNRILDSNASSYTAKKFITNLTFNEVMQLSFAIDEDVHPCELSEFLIFCKYNKVIPYLSLRSDIAWNPSLVITNTLSLLKKFDMESVVIWNLYTFNESVSSDLNKVSPTSLKCYTLNSPSSELTTTEVIKAVQAKCNYICLWNEEQQRQLNGDVFEIAKFHGIRFMSLLNANATTEQVVNAMLNGIVGFQNYGILPGKMDSI